MEMKGLMDEMLSWQITARNSQQGTKTQTCGKAPDFKKYSNHVSSESILPELPTGIWETKGSIFQGGIFFQIKFKTNVSKNRKNKLGLRFFFFIWKQILHFFIFEPVACTGNYPKSYYLKIAFITNDSEAEPVCRGLSKISLAGSAWPSLTAAWLGG